MKIIYLGAPTEEKEEKRELTRKEQYIEFFSELLIVLAGGAIGAFALLGIITYFEL